MRHLVFLNDGRKGAAWRRGFRDCHIRSDLLLIYEKEHQTCRGSRILKSLKRFAATTFSPLISVADRILAGSAVHWSSASRFEDIARCFQARAVIEIIKAHCAEMPEALTSLKHT
jgi:hypothetical protein